jgi:sulfoxide reductase heme-binding subunit YedZ
VLKVWRNPRDRISALRIFTLMCLFAPLSKAIYDSDSIMLDARPITNLIHRTGDWALIFLLVALAVRPLSRILRFSQLLDVRRMIGVGAFVYAAAHFTLYIFDLKLDWREIASEIVHRNRLTLGFVALLGLTALAATSTNGMVRRLGPRRWQRLHQAISSRFSAARWRGRWRRVGSNPAEPTRAWTGARVSASGGGALASC